APGGVQRAGCEAAQQDPLSPNRPSGLLGLPRWWKRAGCPAARQGPLTPDLPSGFLGLENWRRGGALCEPAMPDHERLSLPLCVEAFPIELGGGSPNRSVKARREAENISALEIAEPADQLQ